MFQVYSVETEKTCEEKLLATSDGLAITHASSLDDCKTRDHFLFTTTELFSSLTTEKKTNQVDIFFKKVHHFAPIF